MKAIAPLFCMFMALALNVEGQTVFKVKYKSQADLKIFFIKYESQAGWQNLEKQHLLL